MMHYYRRVESCSRTCYEGTSEVLCIEYFDVLRNQILDTGRPKRLIYMEHRVDLLKLRRLS